MPTQNVIGPADNMPVCCVAVLSGDRERVSVLIVIKKCDIGKIIQIILIFKLKYLIYYLYTDNYLAQSNNYLCPKHTHVCWPGEVHAPV